MPRLPLPARWIFFALALAPFATAAFEVKLTDAKGQPIADAVVSLVPLDPPAVSPSNPPTKLTPPAAPLIVMQRGQEFIPYVTPIVVGSRVSFPNKDTEQHQCYSLSPAKKFTLPLYAGEDKAPIVFDQPGVVALGCNIHDWMVAYIVVLETPWFALSTTAGTATLADAPPGRYRLEIWHPRLAKTDTRELTLSSATSAPLAIALTLKPDRRIRRSTEKSGGGYK